MSDFVLIYTILLNIDWHYTTANNAAGWSLVEKDSWSDYS